MDETILVTGGTGLLGSHLLHNLLLKNKKVVAIKRPSSKLEECRKVFGYYCEDTDQAEKLFGKIQWKDADLLNQAALEEMLTDVGQVYHCAAMVSFQPRDSRKMIRYNTTSTESVVNACLDAGVKKLLHVSSNSAIGRPLEGAAATEANIWSPSKRTTAYAKSKFRSEMEVWRGMEEGLQAVIVNPSIILGPGFWKRGSSSMFSRVAGGLRYGTPGITGFVGVQDVVSAMLQLMDSDISGERYILNENNYAYLDIFRMMGDALGSGRKLKQASPALLRNLARLDAAAGIFTGIRHITSRHIWAAFGEARFSSEKIREALHMEFTPLKQVIEEVAGYYRQDFPR